MDLLEIEKKWQKKWAEDKIYSFNTAKRDKKYYTLEMFSYPSGAKLHVGHWYNFGPSDSLPASKACRAMKCSSRWALTPSDCRRKITP